MIRATDLEKRFGVAARLRGVSFELARGETLVVTGPNGSGKTTLLRLLAGLTAPSRGTLEVDVDRGRIGFLSHEPLVYRELTALENLELFGRLYRVPERRERIGMLLERFGLWDARNERVATYSQRDEPAARALPGVSPRAGPRWSWTSRSPALDEGGAALLDSELAALVAARARSSCRPTIPPVSTRYATARLALA